MSSSRISSCRNNSQEFSWNFLRRFSFEIFIFNFKVQPDSPAQKELLRGDIITKVEDYDARDLRHEDAQLLFRTQDNKIRLVVRRDNKIAMNSSKANPISSLPPANVIPSYVPQHDPYVPHRWGIEVTVVAMLTIYFPF